MKILVRIVIVLLIVAAAGFGLWTFFQKQQAMIAQHQAMMEMQMAPKPVPVTQPCSQTVTEYYEFTGTTEAYEAVDVRARVSGYLENITFEDGADIQAGQVLFRIEPDSFQSVCDQAQAQVKSCQANLVRAELDLKRVEKAARNNAVSQQEVSTKQADRDMAAAALKAAQATLTDAQLKLSYTEIKAPISGRMSRRMVDTGNLVGSGENTLLATLLRLDPIYVYFNVSENIIIEQINQGKLNNLNTNPVQCLISLNGEQNYKYSGTVDYIDNQLDKSTGTITMRAKLDNPSGTILPGMFVRVKLAAVVRENALTVDEKAICSDLNSKYLLVVGQDNVIERRSIKLGTAINGNRVILSGLSADDTYVVQGLHMARPGFPIVPVPADTATTTAQNNDQNKPPQM